MQNGEMPKRVLSYTHKVNVTVPSNARALADVDINHLPDNAMIVNVLASSANGLVSSYGVLSGGTWFISAYNHSANAISGTLTITILYVITS